MSVGKVLKDSILVTYSAAKCQNCSANSDCLAPVCPYCNKEKRLRWSGYLLPGQSHCLMAYDITIVRDLDGNVETFEGEQWM